MDQKEIIMEYKVTIEETISQEFIIKADNEEDLKYIIYNDYRNGNLILDNPSLLDTKININNSNEWIKIKEL